MSRPVPVQQSAAPPSTPIKPQEVDDALPVRLRNPHTLDLRESRAATRHVTDRAREFAVNVGLSPMKSLHHQGWWIHVQNWEQVGVLMAICAPGGRTVLLVYDGLVAHWRAALTGLPLYRHSLGMPADADEAQAGRAWQVAARVHEIALSQPTDAVALWPERARQARADLWWAVLPADQVDAWRNIVADSEHAEEYYEAGMTLDDLAAGWDIAETDATINASHVAKLFGCGLDPSAAEEWLRSLPRADEWPVLIDAGYTPVDGDDLVQASWARVGGMSGHTDLSDEQRDLRMRWVTAGLPATVAVPAMAAGLSLAEALAPDLDSDVVAAMAALRI